MVDDGSTDATAAMVESYAARYPNVRLLRLAKNSGKGFAVKTGMLHATGDLRLFADADGATPIAELERLKRTIDEGADVAVASRALADDVCTVEAMVHRKVIGGIFNLLVRAVTVKGIRDTQCGFKLFTAASANAAFPLQQIARFGFDVEILFICRKKGFRIKEVPVNWAEVPKSKVSLLRDSFRMFMDLFKIRLNSIGGAYGRD